MAAAFQNIGKADEIGVDICGWVFQAISNPRLGREVNDHVRREVVGNLVENLLVFEQPFGGGKIGILQQHLVTALFQSDIIVIGHAVVAVHDKSLG